MNQALRWGRVSHCGTYEIPENTARTKGTSDEGRAVSCQNAAGTCGANPHKTSTACSANVRAIAEKNPGALAGATGADSNDLRITSEEYRVRLEHARTLAFAIGQCDPRDACWIMAEALSDLAAGLPGAPLFSHMDNAASWADLASEPELKAFMWACWQRLSPRAQAAFLRHIEGRAAA